MRIEKSRIEFDRAFKFFRSIGIALFHGKSLTGSNVSFRQLPVQLQRVRARLARFLPMRFAIAAKKMHVCGRKSGPGAGKIWIELCRTLEHFPRQSDILERPFLKKFAPA